MALSLTALIIKVVLPVMFAAMIITGLQSIKVDSLDPNVNNAQDAIGSMGPTDVTIGTGVGPETAEEQFRETMVFNILTAQNCDMIGMVEDSSSMPKADSFQAMGDGGKSHFDTFDKIKEMETSFFCAGASNTIDVIDAPEVVDQEWASQQGHDMEGVLGRINFEINQSLVIDDPRLIGINLPASNDSWGQMGQPEFWNGDRMSVMVPPGITSSACSATSDLDIYPGESTTGRDQGSNSGDRFTEAIIYAYRLRMIDVPIVKEGFREYDEVLDCERPDRESPTTLNRFLFGSDPANPTDPTGSEGEEAAKYVLCKGAEGYVQSNAGSIDNSGEADGDDPTPEDVVYPKLQLTRNAESCMNTSEYRVDLSQTSFDDTGCSVQNSLDGVEIGSEFYIGNISDEEHHFNISCGFQQTEVETASDGIMGGAIEYYRSVPTSQQCEYRTYDITERPFRGPDGQVNYGGEKTEDGQLVFNSSGFTSTGQRYDFGSNMDIQEITVSFEKSSGSDSVWLSSQIDNSERITLKEGIGGSGSAEASIRGLSSSDSASNQEIDYPDGEYELVWDLKGEHIGLEKGSQLLVWYGNSGIETEPSTMDLEVDPRYDGEILINSVEIRGKPNACTE